MSAWKHHGLKQMAVSMVGEATNNPPNDDVAREQNPWSSPSLGNQAALTRRQG